MTSNDINQLDILASILDDIGKHLKAIEFEAEKLEKFYGIQICGIGVKDYNGIHLYSGIELVEMALRKVAIEEYSLHSRKTINHNGTNIFQIAVPPFFVYKKAGGGMWEVTNHEKQKRD